MSDPKPDAPLVLVMVGTDHHPFDRLVDWADQWLAARPGTDVRMITQYGHTHPAARAEGRDFIPRAELDELLAAADVVVSHGGPSTIVETRRRGLVPIVVARTVSLGEHVDDHQQRFARVMSSRGLIMLCETQEALFAALDQAVENPMVTSAADEPLADPAESALRLGRLVDEILSRRKLRRRWLPAAFIGLIRPAGRG